MKTFEFRPHVHGRPKSKIILIMKICTFILLIFNLGLSASGYSQQKKVTLAVSYTHRTLPTTPSV